MRLLLNFAAFQIGWFACVLGAANGFPWLGPVVVAAVVAGQSPTQAPHWSSPPLGLR